MKFPPGIPSWTLRAAPLALLALACVALAVSEPGPDAPCFREVTWEYPFVGALACGTDVPLRVPVTPDCALVLHAPDTIHVYAHPDAERTDDECVDLYHELQRRIREGQPRRSGS